MAVAVWFFPCSSSYGAHVPPREDNKKSSFICSQTPSFLFFPHDTPNITSIISLHLSWWELRSSQAVAESVRKNTLGINANIEYAPP